MNSKQKERKHKLQKMFDHFFIFGYDYHFQPSKSETIHPSLLCAYPSTENKETPEELKQISAFCFPNGFKELKEESKTKPINIIDTFTFYFKKTHQRIYITCVTFSAKKGSCLFFSNKVNTNYPFCMCMISKIPCPSKHIKFMIKLIYILIGKLAPDQNLPKVPKHSNIKGLCYLPLIFDKNYMSVAICEGMNVPEIFVKELIYYQQEQQQDNKVNLDPNKYFLYPTIHTLLSCLSIDNLVKAFTAVLLERKVLFVSKSVSKYSSAVIALNSLSFQFNNVSLILPIVPKEFEILLDSPVPYIAGSSFYNSNADLIIDLDNGLFINKNNDPDLPAQNELIRKLESLIDYERDSITIPVKTFKFFFNNEKINPKFLSFVNSIDDDVYPICHISDLQFVLNKTTSDLIKILFDAHVFPRLANFAKSLKDFKSFDDKNYMVKNANSTEEENDFYHEFFSTQCGTSLLEKYKESSFDSLKLFI